MSDPHQPDTELREELVAYLDGELPPEEARAVEARLSHDERYRREMQGFDRAWSALEELPQATVDDTFTKTTIEMVAVAAEKDLAEQTQTLPFVRRKRTLWIAAIAGVAATLGFALARIALDRPDRVLLANLPIVQQLDAYGQNLSPEFLTALDTQANDILEPYRDEELERQLETLTAINAESNSERRERVEKMSDGEKAALRANYVRFRESAPAYRDQLVELHAQLRDAENSEQLQRTMLAYWAWLQERRNGGADQADLRSAQSVDERLERIRDIDRGQNRRVSLSPDEADKLRAVVKSLAEDREFNEFTKRALANRQRGSKPDGRDDRSRNRNTAGAIVMLHWAARQQPDDAKVQALWSRVHSELLNALLPDTQASIAREDQPGHVLLRLTGEAMMEGYRPAEEELEAFFASDEIDAKRMQELLAMPREEMLRQLRWDYRRHQFGGEEPWPWREDRRGSGDRRFEGRGEPRNGPPRPAGPRFDDAR